MVLLVFCLFVSQMFHGILMQNTFNNLSIKYLRYFFRFFYLRFSFCNALDYLKFKIYFFFRFTFFYVHMFLFFIFALLSNKYFGFCVCCLNLNQVDKEGQNNTHFGYKEGLLFNLIPCFPFVIPYFIWFFL